jgi:hypothetical protein
MKIGYYKDTDYLHLLLETNEDIEKYYDVWSNIEAEGNVGLLFGFKSQGFRKTLSDYLCHEDSYASSSKRLLAFRLDSKQTDTSLIEACSISDKILIDKFLLMKKIRNNFNQIVRLNPSGGMCGINDLSDYENIIEIDDSNMKILTNYLINKTIEDNDLVINSRTIIIENSKTAEIFAKRLNKAYGFNNIQVLNFFKNRTYNYKDSDYIELLENGIKNGLENICIDTTGQDLRQLLMINNISRYLETTNHKLNLYILTSNKEVEKILINSENLKIHWMERISVTIGMTTFC